ncbi:hyccin-like [Anopheles albimanus]|uniref:hyccin-like n=1 Tax=Anopheles albimanus TaxID=7167 RepID=UPI0016408A21|nr:hyccin-like [Anopheles albimanus]XP_035785393.1 hyccin-like [Anopheles albimanus]XP_035785394.1 hyccin-like [Anopheles albimanus]
MAEAIIADWIADYSGLQESELRTFAAQHENDFEISKALYSILNERTKYKDLIHPICNQLCNFYRSNEIELRRFTLQFVPMLIYLYLNSVALGDKKGCRSIETLLICIYNIEVSSDDGSPKVVSFRMPVLAQASVYHEEKSLQPSDLRRWEENSNKDINWGPLPSIESINAQNRLKVMTALLFTYNQQLNQIHKPALYHLCKTTSLLVNQGFPRQTGGGHMHRSSYGSDPISPQQPMAMAAPSHVVRPPPRIAVNSQFLVELAHANYFAMFNEFASAAIEAVTDLHSRACYEMLPEVILVTNAIRNSLHANPSGQPSDGPMGISVALTPATTTVTVSKSMITNASFRTKKLPDDIPIQGPNKEENGGLQHLSSINEESEGGAPSVSESGQKVSAGGGGGGGTATATTGKPKDSTKHKVLGGFKKLKPEKEKDKDKDKDREKEKDGNALVSLGGPALANSTGGGTSLSGSSLVEEAKALMSATKKINSKEKLSVSGVTGGQPATVVVLSNGNILMGATPSPAANGDSGADGGLLGATLVTSAVSTGTANGGTMLGMQSLSDIGESFDSGSELIQHQQQQQHTTNTSSSIVHGNNSNGSTTIKTTVLDMKSHGQSSIQVSQV